MSPGVGVGPEPAVVEVETDQGPGRVHLHAPQGSSGAAASGLLALGHGAGGGVGAADLQVLTRATERGWWVALVEQPWRVAGRKIATPPPSLDRAWRQILPWLHDHAPAPRLVVGGRSAGARVACRTSLGDPASTPAVPRADGVLALAFPLHPPGRPEKSRAHELATPVDADIPTLVIQGGRDPFGSPEEVRAAVPTGAQLLQVHEVPGNHSPTTSLVAMASHVTSWLDGLP